MLGLIIISQASQTFTLNENILNICEGLRIWDGRGIGMEGRFRHTAPQTQIETGGRVKKELHAKQDGKVRK